MPATQHLLLPMMALVLAAFISDCARTSDLMDESFLQIDSVRSKFETNKMIHDDDNMTKVYIHVDKEDRFRYSDYCPEEYYFTVDPHRKPETILHRRCNQKVMNRTTWNCLQDSDSDIDSDSRLRTTQNNCKDQETYRKIKLRKKDLYQKVYIGCYCSARKKKVLES